MYWPEIAAKRGQAGQVQPAQHILKIEGWMCLNDRLVLASQGPRHLQVWPALEHCMHKTCMAITPSIWLSMRLWLDTLAFKSSLLYKIC